MKFLILIFQKTVNPVWNETFRVVIEKNSEITIEFDIYDQDLLKKDDFLGICSTELKDTTNGVYQWLQVNEKPGFKPVRAKGNLKVRVQWELDRIDELKRYCTDLYQKLFHVNFFFKKKIYPMVKLKKSFFSKRSIKSWLLKKKKMLQKSF